MRKGFLKSVVVSASALLLAATIAACGGGSDGTTANNTTPTTTAPAATSAAAKSMTLGLAQYTQALLTQAMNAMGAGAQVVKTDPTINCTAIDDYSGTCTITDAFGGSCTMTLSANQTWDLFTLNMSCDNFVPESPALVDGDFTATATVNQDPYASVKTNPWVAKTDTDASDDCSLTDAMDYPPECSDSQGETCSEAEATVYLEYLVGARGLSVTDECGTYEMGSGTTMTTALCADLNSLLYLFTFTLNGTFNGSNVNESYSMDCDFN